MSRPRFSMLSSMVCVVALFGLGSSVFGAPPDGMYVGTTGQGRAFEVRVAGGRVDQWMIDLSVSCQYGSSSGGVRTTISPSCAIETDGSFVCGSSSCPTMGVSSQISGQFFTDDTVTGDVDLEARVGGGCCNLNTTFSASLEGGGGGGGDGWDCGNAGYDNNTTANATYFGGGHAGDPNYMFAVKFELSDFGYQAGNTQITGFCAANQIAFTGGPWPNEVFIYPDSGGMPNASTILGQGTISTGDGTGPSGVTLASPVTLNGDFWLVMRGDPMHAGEDFNMEYDTGSNVGNSYSSDSGISGLSLSTLGNFMLRATLQEGHNGGGPGTGAYNYFLAAIAHTPGVGDALWRSKLGALNRSGSSAEVTFTYYWKNGPTTVKTAVAKRAISHGSLMTWDDAAVSLFGITAKSSGSVLVNSTQPLVITARTYNVGEDGSFGSFMPGVTAADGLSTGEMGVLTQLTGNNDFRTNVGLVNLSNKSCQARVRVVGVGGAAAGSPVTKTLGAYMFTQINDVFAETGAGSRNDAYATVEVLTSGCHMWAYGAVIDGTGAFPGTDDATTIPLSVID